MATRLTPPMLQGTAQQQIYALRDWMFQRVKELDAVQRSAETENVVATRDAQGRTVVSKGETANLLQNVSNLKALIQKTANEVVSYADSKVEEYNSLYVAQSEFGEYKEEAAAQMTTTAKGVVEEYGILTSITSLQNYYSAISGTIMRGLVRDPEYDADNVSDIHPTEYVTGIAISQELNVIAEGKTNPNDPNDESSYYELDSGQTFGLYTSTGWQFWINGQKKGWFNSLDGILHVSNIKIDNKFNMGSWSFQHSGDTFGIIYTG